MFTAVGILGGVPDNGGAVSAGVSSGVSVAGTAVMGSVSGNPVEHTKATRSPKVPGGKPPAAVHVGGGGRGAPMRGTNVPGNSQQDAGESYSEHVGRIVDESKQQGEKQAAVGEDGETEQETEVGDGEATKPNPKKRMWEEEKKEAFKEAEQEKQRLRDEL